MKRFLMLLAGGTALSSACILPAAAADLPYKSPAYVAPAFYDWTGFYIGANGGYLWSSDFAVDAKGWVYGGQLGYNWQAGRFVFGIEGDIQGTSVSESETGLGITVTGKIPAFATVRGRLGYAFDRILIYGTGGWAYTKNELSATNGVLTVSDSKWSSGYTFGGGVEWAAWDRWSVKAEYLYVHSGDVELTLAGVTAGGSYNMNVARLGLNYRF